MQTETYKKYIRSPEWAAVKQKRIELDNGRCVMCRRTADRCRNGLQVHHISYKNLTHEDVFQDLVTLCPRCHLLIHRYYDRRRKA